MMWKIAPVLIYVLTLQQQSYLVSSWATTAAGTSTAGGGAAPDDGRDRRRRIQNEAEEELPASTSSNRLTTTIRSTTSADIPAVAQLLAKATTTSSATGAASGPKKKTNNIGGGWNWKSAIDQLWAKSDMESLLSCRQQAIQYGRKAVQNSQQQLLLLANSNENDDDDSSSGSTPYSDSDFLRLVWSQSGAASDKLRQTIDQASQETGENNIWRYHNMAIPPSDISWLQHLQLSVVVTDPGVIKKDDSQKDILVGFCEVAMLTNPTIASSDDDNAPPCFTPAITNLAIDPEWRRRGIATRLLKTAERYVKQYWRGTASLSESSSSSSNDEDEDSQQPTLPSMGLYVEKDNQDAMALYKNLGYETTVTCDGGDILGEMWYMTRQL